jgi:hypothetical protein
MESILDGDDAVDLEAENDYLEEEKEKIHALESAYPEGDYEPSDDEN